MRKNYKMIISYDGTRYSGWQSQGNTAETIQSKLEAVLSRLAGEKVDVIGAGRTDSGVHALGMVANCHMSTALSEDEIRSYVNKYLPDDICVIQLKEASDRFHSRYNSVGKTYKYTCFVSTSVGNKPIFDRHYVYVIHDMPDVNRMRRAAKHLMGEHDYKSFCGNSHFNKNSVRNVDDIKISVNENHITFTYHADGFLQNMVRILTGTLLEVGFYTRSEDSMGEIFAAMDRKMAGYMVPAKGLCLVEVDY